MSSTPSTPLSSKDQKPIRDSNIELLRILLMCGVVLLHYNGGVGNALATVTPGSWNHVLLLGGEGLFICAVDLFVLISGYFSCTSQRRQSVKILELILQVIVVNCCYYLITCALQGSFSPKTLLRNLLPNNYFVILYSVLYLISPYLNRLLLQLDKKQRTTLLILSLVLFSVLPILADMIELIIGTPLIGLNTVGAYGDSWGYTIVNFTLMYLMGAYLRLENITLKKRYCLPAIGILTILLGFTGSLNNGGHAWSYCNPLVIAQAVAVFLLFRHIRLKSRIINELAKGAFTCFLLHSHILPFFRADKAVSQPVWVLFAHIVLTCVTIYLCSYVVYLVWKLISRPVLQLFAKPLSKIDVFITLESSND